MNAELGVNTYQENSFQPYKPEREPQLTVHDIYPVEREIRFVGENLHLSNPELEFYIQMNIKGMLDEFVGKLSYKVFSYVKRDDYFEFAGIRVEDSYKRAAELAGTGSREESDWIGFSKIQKKLLNGANTAVLVCPPENADYSFVNIFSVDDESVSVHLICYPEQSGTILKSKALLSTVGGDEKNYDTANEFLQNPLIIENSANPGEKIGNILHFLNISDEKINCGRQFEEEVERELDGWIKSYAQKTIQLAKFDGSYDEYEKLKAELKVYLEGIYNRARKIKERIDNPHEIVDSLIQAYQTYLAYPSRIGFELAEVIHYAKSEEPIYKGGSDCMPTQSGIFGVNDIVAALSGGKTIDQLVRNNIVENKNSSICSGCGLSSKDNHYHCLNCNQRYADETNKENRTKKCTCGFKFNC